MRILTRLGPRSAYAAAAVAALACAPLALLGPTANAQTGPLLTWKAPVLVEYSPFGNRHVVTAVACPSSGLCVVGDDVGNILTSTDPLSAADTWKTAAISPPDAIRSLKCATTGFCVALAGVKGHAPRIFTSVDPTGGPRAWTLASARLPISAISCPSTKLCVAVGKGAITTSTNPTAGRHSVWKVTGLGPQLSSTHLTGVSCPRLTLCVAVDKDGNVYTSKNPTGGKSAWTVTLVATAQIRPVTCPSASFCAALVQFGGLIYSTNPAGGGSTWHLIRGPNQFATSLTCTSATFCATAALPTNVAGNLYITTDPEGGSAAWHLDGITEFDNVTTVTCASPHLCVAGGNGGDVISSTNPGGGLSAWTTVNVTGFSGFVRLDCPFAALCLASDDAGNILTSTRPGGGASAWHAAHVVLGPPNGDGVPDEINEFSCPATNLCVAVDDQGNVYWSTNPAGGASAWSVAKIDPFTKIASIACPNTSLCVAGDVRGNILTSTNPTGGASAWQAASIGSDSNRLYVTCPTASLCLASGDATIFTSASPAGGASTWHPSVFFGGNFAIGPITCPTTTLCVATATGAIFSSRHPTGGILDWNDVHLPSSFAHGAMSCPSAKFCVAGVFASFDPASSKASAWQASGISPTALSCPSTSLCVAGDGIGQVQTGRPRTPTSTALRLSAKRVTFGHEQGEQLTVTVRPQVAGPVVITAKTTTICTLRRLAHGTASCTLTRKQLRPGTYRLIASYPGNSAFLGSTSAAKTLTVVKPR